MTKARSLSEYDRAMLRVTLGTAPGVFTNENVRRLLGVDETYMTCPLCGTAAQGRVDGVQALPRVQMRRMRLRLWEEYVSERNRKRRGNCEFRIVELGM
jgi:hypothetical protein